MYKKQKHFPQIKPGDVYDMMDAENISRMHLELDPLPYKWYKVTMQLEKAGLMRFADSSDAETILAYCVATRKKRREIPKLHDCYMAVLRILQLRFELHKTNETPEKTYDGEPSNVNIKIAAKTVECAEYDGIEYRTDPDGTKIYTW